MNNVLKRELWIKKPFFQMIKKGLKTLEGRIGYPSMKKIKVGSTVLLLTGDKDQWEKNRKNFPADNVLPLKVAAIRNYKNFGEALSKENIDKLLPGSSTKEALYFYNRIFPLDKVREYGVIIFEFEVVD